MRREVSVKAKITYARLQEQVAAAAGIPKKEAQTLLKEMTAAVGAGLVADGKVTLAGLGRFNRKVQRARRGRNPQTGEPLDIPEKNRVDFLPEAQWRRIINREFQDIPVVPEPSPDPPAPPATPKMLPPREAGSSRRTNPEKPTQPVDAEIVAPATSPPASPAADAGDIAPAEETDRKRRHKLAPTIGVILLVAAALFFLWPRSQAPAPPAAPRPMPTRAAVSESPRPPETSQPESHRPVPAEIATASESPATVPAAEAAQAAAPATASHKPAPVTRYEVAAGDSLWKIADNVYHYPYFWPVIFQKNYKTLQHPDTLIVGMQLAIPVFEGRFGQLAESDFQQLADGYLQVYRAYRRNHHPRAPYYLWVAYRLRAHWVPDHELMLEKPEDLQFIRQLRGQGLIH
jgi:DNA-binding protein HU-beta